MSETTRVVHLEDQENWIEVGQRAFLVVRDSAGGCHTIADKCPHRGGPLHLGSIDPSGAFVVCPWHHSRTRVSNLVARALPTVRGGERVTVVIGPEVEGTPHALRRTVLLDCEAALLGAGKSQ